MNLQADTWLMPHTCSLQGSARKLSTPPSARALTLSARGRVLHRTSVISVFTCYVLCKDINLLSLLHQLTLLVFQNSVKKKKCHTGHHKKKHLFLSYLGLPRSGCCHINPHTVPYGRLQLRSYPVMLTSSLIKRSRGC